MEVGGLRVESITDRIDGPSKWTFERDVHILYLYEAGSYHWLETWLDDRRTSLGDPLPGEMWLAPAGRRYHGEAKGGGVRYIEVEIPAARLIVAPGTRALAGHYDMALAALVRALAAGDAGAADPLVTTLAKTLEAMVVRPDSSAVTQRINNCILDLERTKVAVVDGLTGAGEINRQRTFAVQMVAPVDALDGGIELIGAAHRITAKHQQHAVGQP